jgi:hypothetical protein
VTGEASMSAVHTLSTDGKAFLRSAQLLDQVKLCLGTHWLLHIMRPEKHH